MREDVVLVKVIEKAKILRRRERDAAALVLVG